MPIEIIEELKTHKVINLGITSHIKLYFMNNVFCFFDRSHNKLAKLYDVGSAKLEKSLDIVHIIKNLRKIKILVKNKLICKDT